MDPNCTNQEISINLAIQDYQTGVYSSLRATARAYNISRSTLTNRINGTLPRGPGHANLQILNPVQEEYLADWILDLDNAGHAPSYKQTRGFARQILLASRPKDSQDAQDIHISPKWVYNFIKRNPRVKPMIGQVVDQQRVKSATYSACKEWFELFDRVRDSNNVKTCNIWNVDETGLSSGVCKDTKVIGAADKKRTQKESPQTRDWVSIVESVSAEGKKIQPLVIFKGQNLQTTWFNDTDLPEFQWITQKKGFTSYQVGLNWVKTIFIPQTQPEDTEHRILLMDGHGSHATPEFMWECKQAKIHLLIFPAHCTHILQPLNLTCFNAVKVKYRRQILDLACLDNAAPVKKARFNYTYQMARDEGLTERVIRSGFRDAGLVPPNHEVVLAKLPRDIEAEGPKINLEPPKTPRSQRIRKRSEQWVTPYGLRDLTQAIKDCSAQEEVGLITRKLFNKTITSLSHITAQLGEVRRVILN
jgi:hypothetical protein